MMNQNTVPSTSWTADAAPVIDCQRILLEGTPNAIDYVGEAQRQGLCAVQQAAGESPTALSSAGQNHLAGATGLPWLLVTVGAVTAISIGLDKAATYGAKRRGAVRRENYALSGGYVGQAALGDRPLSPECQYSPDIQDIQTQSHSNLGAGHPVADTVLSEPLPWGMTTAQQATYQDDRTASDLSTQSCWAFLKNCTVKDFQQKVGSGNIDPVAVQEGLGKVTAREACHSWFAHDICEIGKVGWAVFGSDGQGGTSRAKATAALVKAFRDEYQAISA
jgi:hypothetical protein